MAKVRAVGADVSVRGATETVYGTAPGSGYKLLSVRSFALDSERPLGYDPLLGQGRDAADPFYEAISVNGDIGVPLDVRGLGFWLHGLFGTDTATQVGASGDFYFSAQPAAGSTITLNGVDWTFVASGATGNQTNLGANLAATLTTLATNLNASANAEIAKVTWSATASQLLGVFDTIGASGNTYTLAASSTSNARPSNSTLWGGGWQHQFTSGGALPSKTLELGHTQLVTPAFYRFAGCKFGTLAFDLSRTGPANATVNVIAQGRASAGTTIDGSAAAYVLDRFSQGRGAVRMNGAQVGNITAGSFSFSNNLEPVETIRSDGLIDGVDEGEATATGGMTVRFANDAALTTAADGQTPVALEYNLSLPIGWLFKVTMPRVFLPKPKATVTGPAGVEASFDWRAAKDATAGYLARVVLVNDMTPAYA